MKAVVITRPCTASELTLAEVPIPQVRPGWVLVKIRAFGINRAEIYTRQGHSPGVPFPRIIGIECVGEVADASDSGLKPGQTVVSLMNGMGRQFDGSYAEYALIPATQVYPIEPPQHYGWDWATLAAVPETWFTAWGSLTTLKLQAGDALLIRGGSSACGLAALQLAVRMGAQVFSTTRNAAHAEKIRALAHAIGSAAVQVLLDDGQLAAAHTARFDKALELVGAATLRDTLRCLAPGGVACFTGVLSGWVLERFEPIDDIPSGRYLSSFHSDSVNRAGIEEMFAFIRRHRIAITPPVVFALQDIAQAHALMESNQVAGKIVVVNP